MKHRGLLEQRRGHAATVRTVLLWGGRLGGTTALGGWDGRGGLRSFWVCALGVAGGGVVGRLYGSMRRLEGINQ